MEIKCARRIPLHGIRNAGLCIPLHFLLFLPELLNSQEMHVPFFATRYPVVAFQLCALFAERIVLFSADQQDHKKDPQH